MSDYTTEARGSVRARRKRRSLITLAVVVLGLFFAFWYAWSYYQHDTSARAADRQPQKPGLMMANIYRTLLREIEAQDFRVLHQRTSLTPLRKLWIAARTHVRGR